MKRVIEHRMRQEEAGIFGALEDPERNQPDWMLNTDLTTNQSCLRDLYVKEGQLGASRVLFFCN